ncbi:peptidoglycan editing factor PgeF [Polynucleobacter necessarius]|uniref:peptidoglycan editing factor PgeF n=1 Tax=Polynucleobacter necessarius TaxID=576610 RepID=UPI000E09D309|nr:peptidoglycan editing factor PgeF [Polynucleobacter necessarius]HAT39944.1 peptidoglycan editing factor PgeF [Polynucleobacter sp.]
MSFIAPQWPAPKTIHCLVSTRSDGVSGAPFHSLNLGDHVGDNAADVLLNRTIFTKKLPNQPIWLKQTHSIVVSTPKSRALPGCDEILADASVSNVPNEVLVIMTADCLPVLLTNTKGTIIGAAHSGWRGLSAGILENTVNAMLKLDSETQSSDLIAWMGPAIGPDFFEVGQDVKTCFQESGVSFAENAFKPIPNKPGKFLADICRLARGRLETLGLKMIFGAEHCTVRDQELFFSYRRDGQTGRFASAIWISK